MNKKFIFLFSLIANLIIFNVAYSEGIKDLVFSDCEKAKLEYNKLSNLEKNAFASYLGKVASLPTKQINIVSSTLSNTFTGTSPKNTFFIKSDEDNIKKLNLAKQCSFKLIKSINENEDIILDQILSNFHPLSEDESIASSSFKNSLSEINLQNFYNSDEQELIFLIWKLVLALKNKNNINANLLNLIYSFKSDLVIFEAIKIELFDYTLQLKDQSKINDLIDAIAKSKSLSTENLSKLLLHLDPQNQTGLEKTFNFINRGICISDEQLIFLIDQNQKLSENGISTLINIGQYHLEKCPTNQKIFLKFFDFLEKFESKELIRFLNLYSKNLSNKELFPNLDKYKDSKNQHLSELYLLFSLNDPTTIKEKKNTLISIFNSSLYPIEEKEFAKVILNSLPASLYLSLLKEQNIIRERSLDFISSGHYSLHSSCTEITDIYSKNELNLSDREKLSIMQILSDNFSDLDCRSKLKKISKKFNFKELNLLLNNSKNDKKAVIEEIDCTYFNSLNNIYTKNSKIDFFKRNNRCITNLDLNRDFYSKTLTHFEENSLSSIISLNPLFKRSFCSKLITFPSLSEEFILANCKDTILGELGFETITDYSPNGEKLNALIITRIEQIIFNSDLDIEKKLVLFKKYLLLEQSDEKKNQFSYRLVKSAFPSSTILTRILPLIDVKFRALLIETIIASPSEDNPSNDEIIEAISNTTLEKTDEIKKILTLGQKSKDLKIKLISDSRMMVLNSVEFDNILKSILSSKIDQNYIFLLESELRTTIKNYYKTEFNSHFIEIYF